MFDDHFQNVKVLQCILLLPECTQSFSGNLLFLLGEEARGGNIERNYPFEEVQPNLMLKGPPLLIPHRLRQPESGWSWKCSKSSWGLSALVLSALVLSALPLSALALSALPLSEDLTV